MLGKLTPGERACAEKVDVLLGDEKNREKIQSIRTVDEAIVFMEENGFAYTDEQKEEIRKRAGELASLAKTRELTPEDLASAAWQGH